MAFDFFKKKKKKKEEEEIIPADEEFSGDEPTPSELPPGMEEFKLPEPGEAPPKETPMPVSPEPLERPEAPRGTYRTEEYGPPPIDEPKEEPAGKFDRIELILQKLDTIDARLRFIEERLRK